MDAGTAAQKINGAGFAHETDSPIPKPTKTPKILDAHGDTLPPSAMTVKNQSVVQIPTWAITAFLLPALAFIVWFTQFYTTTGAEMKLLRDEVQTLKLDKEKEFDRKFTEAIKEATSRGYQLKAAEGDHGKEKK